MAAVAGCERSRAASAGSLVVENHHDRPQVVELEVVTYSSDGESRRTTERDELAVEPGETKRRADYFDTSASYEVVASIPGSDSARVPYGRRGVETESNLVFLEVSETGSINGGLRSV